MSQSALARVSNWRVPNVDPLTGVAADLPGLDMALQTEHGSVAGIATRAAGRPMGSGLATWYGPGFYGRKTASGERFTSAEMTAAHRSLPFGTRVQVVNQRTGRAVVVRINDRGPYRRGAIIDLSRASAQALGIGGTAKVVLYAAE